MCFYSLSGSVLVNNSLCGSVLVTYSLGGSVLVIYSLCGSVLVTYSLGGSVLVTYSLCGSVLVTYSLGGSVLLTYSLCGSVLVTYSLAGSVLVTGYWLLTLWVGVWECAGYLLSLHALWECAGYVLSVWECASYLLFNIDIIPSVWATLFMDEPDHMTQFMDHNHWLQENNVNNNEPIITNTG